MTMDLVGKGFVAVEVPCDLTHRGSGNDLRGQLHRAAQYRDVLLAINARRVRDAVDGVRERVAPRRTAEGKRQSKRQSKRQGKQQG